MAPSKKQIGVIAGGIAVVAAAAIVVTTVVTGNGGAEAAGSASSGSSSDQAAGEAFSVDLTSQNAKDRPRLDEVADAVAALDASGFTPIEPGKLTVATTSFSAPLGVFASDDNSTPIGIEPDIGQLVADGLGLEYDPVVVSWDDWPLGIQSGKYDLIASNVTVTEERKDLYDFASTRKDLLGFYVAKDSDIESIESADDVSGLTIIVGSGTNQEEVLLNWNAELEAAGEAPAELAYYNDTAAASLALKSGRADATFGPNVTAAYDAAVNGETKLVGTLDGGWPETAPIALGTKKGNGLVEAVQLTLNAAIEGGEYQAVLDRWNDGSEAVTESEINPPGLPRS